MLSLGTWLLSSAVVHRPARASISPDVWAPADLTALGGGAPDLVNVEVGSHHPSIDALTPDQLRKRIEDLGWVFVGDGTESDTPEAQSATWVIAHPPGIDAVVTLYRFKSPAYLDAVLPFVQAQEEVQIAQGERTLLYTRIRRNPDAAQALLTELHQ